MKFDKIDWNKAFFKTYFERRSFLHLLVNFNRIWVLHISCFWFYTAFNAPTIYAAPGSSTPNIAMQFSAVALGGAVASLIMLAATVAEFSYVPTTWNNTSHLLNRFAFLLVILGITAGPTIYIAFFDQTSFVARIISYVQFAISVAVVLFFSIVPSGRLFGDRVAGKSRKYLANQTFTASYPALETRARLASIGLWFLVFGCKLTESYFFLTLSFENPIRVMVGMKVQNCNDAIFGSALCMHQPAFALAIMFCMDLVLFFLDTFLWYVIWNTGESSLLLSCRISTDESILSLLHRSVIRYWSLDLDSLEGYVESCTSTAISLTRLAQISSSDCRNECTPKFSLRPTWRSNTSPRSSSRKSGTPSSSRCTESISSPSITSNDYFITKFRPTKMESERFELPSSSSRKTTRSVIGHHCS